MIQRFSTPMSQATRRQLGRLASLPKPNAYVERVIGSIRRDCLDHVVVVSDQQLRRILKESVNYYNRTRTHLSLHKDAPVPRPAKHPELGRVTKIRRVGGLHHEYTRLAA